MEITEKQYEGIKKLFPAHAIDVFSASKGLTILVWASGEEV